MSTRQPRLHRFAAYLVALGLVASAIHAPARAHAAAVQPAPLSTPVVTATSTVTPSPTMTSTTPTPTGGTPALTDTVNLAQYQSVAAAGGLTVVRMPRQIMSGGHLPVLVKTLPDAFVTLTVAFPDGTTFTARHRAGPGGFTRFDPPVTYQPQSSTETAVITVQAIRRVIGLSDTVQGSVAVLQHIVLRAYLKVPWFVLAGQTLAVVVVSNQANAYGVVRVTYPDTRVEVQHGYTDAGGLLTLYFTVSTSDGRAGALWVQTDLSYNGVQITRSRRVALRAPKKPLQR